MLFLRKYVVSTKLHVVERRYLCNTNLEINWSEIHSENKKFIVGVIYRPPKSNSQYWGQFSSCIEKVIDTQLPVFLLGDFNVNLLSDNSNKFKVLLEKQGFINLINGPTNFTT